MADPILELRTVVPQRACSLRDGRTIWRVRDRAYAVVDRDIEALKEAGFSEDEIFEQTVPVAITEVSAGSTAPRR